MIDRHRLDVAAYLERIDYKGPLAPSAETLRKLQRAHLLTVPFENLSIHAHEAIVLEDEALFDKIVRRRRGGFCYEVNGLFAALLKALGFEATMLSAEVANANGGFSQPFDHMTLLVNLEQRWLADVGFGDSFLEPLIIDTTSEQGEDERFRIEPDGNYMVVLRQKDGEWHAEYRFTLQAYAYADFAEMCRYHQTSPRSHFTQNRICSRATTEGRITLSDMRYIVTTKSGREERVLTMDQEYEDILREQFGINERLQYSVGGS
jgi:N-hydroxyarylamine O-acetyltransferase